LDAFGEFIDFSRCTGSPDVAALGGLSGVNRNGLDLPATYGQFAFHEDVSPAFQVGSSSSLQMFLSPDNSSSALSPNNPLTSSSNGCDLLNSSLPLTVTSYKCPHAQCGERFMSRDSCHKHSTLKHPEKPYNCGLLGCDKSFPDERSLKRHLTTTRKHLTSNSLVYTCHCRVSKPRWDKFKEHIRDCKVEKTTSSKYKCSCGEGFQAIPELESHKVVCHPDKRGRPRKIREIPGKENF
jgi:hypothetical protein